MSLETATFPQEEEDVFGNVSSGMSAMLIGALTSPTSLLGKRRNHHQQRPRSGTQSSQRTINNGSQEDDSKRTSWSFPWFSYTSTSPTATHSPPTESRQDDTVQLPPVPPGNSGASDESSVRSSAKKNGRFRSASTASIRQLALHSLGRSNHHQQYTPSGGSSSSTPSEAESTVSTSSTSLPPPSTATTPVESNNGNNNNSGTRTRGRRSGSLSGLMKHARKVSRGFSPHDAPANTDMTPGTATRVASTAGVPAHKSLRSSSWWISRAFREALQHQDQPVSGPQEPQEGDEVQYQTQMNEQLMRTFPMLGDTESVIAGK